MYMPSDIFFPTDPVCQDIFALSVLARELRPVRLGGTYIEGLTLQQEAEAYDTALSGASKVASLNFSGGSYVRAHLLRKHLIRLDYQSDSLKHQARGLSHCQLLSLKLPDEMDYLAEVPACIRSRWALGHAFNCYPLFISCFACLARAPLRQHPQALAYTEDPENRETIRNALDTYRATHGYNPSPERLFQILLGKKKLDTQTSFGSSNSDQQEAEQPELPKPTSLKKVIKQTNKTSHSNNSQPQKTVARQQGSTHSQGRGRPFGPAAPKTSKTNCSSSEPSAPSARRPRAAPRQASHGSPSLPSTTPGTARPVFKNLVANTAYVELDLGEDGEDVD